MKTFIQVQKCYIHQRFYYNLLQHVVIFIVLNMYARHALAKKCSRQNSQPQQTCIMLNNQPAQSILEVVNEISQKDFNNWIFLLTDTPIAGLEKT